MQDCWSFTCCLSWTLGSSSKCSQLKFFYGYYFGRCSSEVGIPEFLGSGRKSWTLNSGRWALNAGIWTLDSGRCTLDAELSTLDAGSGRWTLDSWRWTLGSGHWTLTLTVLEQNQQPVSDSPWLNYWIFFRYGSLRTSWSHLLCRDYWFWLGYF